MHRLLIVVPELLTLRIVEKFLEVVRSHGNRKELVVLATDHHVLQSGVTVVLLSDHVMIRATSKLFLVE
jgi:hypothetical protein